MSSTMSLVIQLNNPGRYCNPSDPSALEGSRDKGILYRRSSSSRLIVYTDLSFTENEDERRSVSVRGAIFFPEGLFLGSVQLNIV